MRNGSKNCVKLFINVEMNAVPQYTLHRESAVFVSAVDIHSDAQLSF